MREDAKKNRSRAAKRRQQMPATWKFGRQQTAKAERAEITQALEAGLGDLYVEMQQASYRRERWDRLRAGERIRKMNRKKART